MKIVMATQQWKDSIFYIVQKFDNWHPLWVIGRSDLAAEIDEVCVWVVDGEHDAVGRVQLNHHWTQQNILYKVMLLVSGWDLTKCAWDLAKCGWNLAKCGWDTAKCGWDLAKCGWNLAKCGWDLAKWLERLTDNAIVATRNSLGFDPSILRHSGIWGAADEAVFNKVKVHKKLIKKSPCFLLAC